ncbi:Protein of unknown function DUF2490 [Emticicia oligotrophica DSM 17448]|uniref:DUF2490 domain-containing protein n=1 Tax=Emticicia oligotrophica (strain DSM 17448 / CIP 109782 / MTCC 6937 / GPTSA100-15) TaxID=929562 RepID=A0ABN4AC47_EMTOG|nr:MULTISPECIES: DUF2490 domain-containing protein [Emticicia]AFK01814.1 Protein of unknown function DUF2490 [Emticicia oligotrophica DSM 17448]
MKYRFLFILSCICTSIFGQTTRLVQDEEQLWLGYFNQSRISNKWGIWFDAHYRTTDHFIKEPSKFLSRLGLMYYINDDLKFTNAYNYANHFPEEGHANISQPEHRIWHQLQLHTKYGKLRTMQWLRLEERFRRKIKNDNELAEGYRFDERIRYNFLLNIPLSSKGIAPKTFSAVLNNEVMLNLSKNNVYNVFDQNRFFAGLAYNIDSHSNFQFGYMNVYQQLASGNRFRNINSIRLFFFQNLDFRKKAKK